MGHLQPIAHVLQDITAIDCVLQDINPLLQDTYCVLQDTTSYSSVL